MIRITRTMFFSLAVAIALSAIAVAESSDGALRVGTFNVDASPPVGSPLAYDPCISVGMPLSARGVVLLGNDDPIVLCAVDWIGIGNGGYTAWREGIADAVGTTPERVAVHCLHQHDAPRCDFSAEALLAEHGLSGAMFDVAFARQTIANVAAAARNAAGNATAVTHVGLGEGRVEKVAPNRRILGDDGKVRAVRYTRCADPDIRAEPEGIIDPMAKAIGFWADEKPVAVLTYYATHPQSYYRTGVAHADFPGMARFLRQTTHNGLAHVHFNGAGGDIGAGKYNDGAHENRQTLAVRLAEGMRDAYQATEKFPIAASDVGWRTLPVALPVAEHLNEETLAQSLGDDTYSVPQRIANAKDLVWLRRCKSGDKVLLSCLRLGQARVLHMPGELSVEYQLAAQKMRPELFVAMAAYGEYATGYICMAKHYEQGGYEASPRASKVAPAVEGVLMSAMAELLEAESHE